LYNWCLFFFQLLDLCVLDSGWCRFTYSTLATAVLYHGLSAEVALNVSGMLALLHTINVCFVILMVMQICMWCVYFMVMPSDMWCVYFMVIPSDVVCVFLYSSTLIVAQFYLNLHWFCYKLLLKVLSINQQNNKF